ncbi:unnamed protein product (macronuclear) [Paramecium tetraurelia]|uniref:Dynein heavy chain linker domain-containing protein n=1 Tax=Paramecium tetraurelia TaxID=5888 RepID=A0C482_PARTE|nr:uncharacterized protein GSPATT00035079001 [Paramecium tetraurelia]CAK65599.1 unnamed protein product [Paramecium tetraurelia]|eukprot:XP_001432996.1 hypothetical protein (macronuclear) [Paramecium tetraurelia strain d4-2]
MKNEQFSSPATLIKANIINNRTMIFTNYLQLDYAMIFEEQLKIINNHQDYIKKLCSLRLEIPNIQVILTTLKQLKQDVLSSQHTQDKQIYETIIKPKTQQMIYHSISLQKNLEGLLNLQEQPKNPCFKKQNNIDQAIKIRFEDQIVLLQQELSQYEELAANMLTSIKHYQAQFDFLKDEKVIKQQQELWDKEKDTILEYLTNKLSQSILNLIQTHQQEMFKITQDEVNPIVHSKGGVVYFYETLSIIDGQIYSIEQIKVQILNYEQQIVQLKVNYHEFEEFYNKIKTIHAEIVALSKKVKQINCTQVQPLLQQYQLSQRKKCSQRMEKLQEEIKQLFFQGQLIEKINVKAIMKNFESFHFDEQIQTIEHQIQEFEDTYTRQQFQVPFSKIKQLSQLIIKFEEDYYNANKMCLEITRLIKSITFVGYISYLNEAINNKYIQALQRISLKKGHLLSFKFCNQEILTKINNLLVFQFPYFDWSEQLDLEKDRIYLIQEQYIWARETVIELSQIKELSSEIKIMKQLLTLDNELEKSLTVIEKYLELKDKLGTERIDIISWPKLELELVNESSQFCNHIIQQINDRVKAIQQLNEIQLLSKLDQIFSDFNQQNQQQLIQLSKELQSKEFSQIIKPQIQIAQQFITVCIQHFDDEIDKKFCQTITYQELEDELGGITKLNQLRHINEQNQNNQELRNLLYDQVMPFMRQKLKSDFSNLFQLKVIQSQGGTNNYDPYKLQLRTDLLYPIYRVDINSNQYCIQEKVKIESIIDQPDLRQLFQEFRSFLNQCTIIMRNNNNDIYNDQEFILQLIDAFEKSWVLNIHLTDLQSIKSFHQNLKQWPEAKQFEQQLLPLGIVLKEEYSKYLEACRQKVLSLTSGISITVDPNQENLIQDMIKFNFNGKVCCLHELCQNYFYRDSLSLIVESLEGNLRLLSNHIVLINGKQLQYNDQIVL